ncbi:hypothetical protein [Mesorhizobium sp.]|uniref:hypothetical protein n=1 Tax=Mesorhizobium sp. TaxID=1871066 RepID=UPI0025D963FC|nr:hypothetical protein [Mesorhizobium sp.]
MSASDKKFGAILITMRWQNKQINLPFFYGDLLKLKANLSQYGNLGITRGEPKNRTVNKRRMSVCIIL